MGQRIIISESDRNHIKKLYEGLNRKVLKEQLEYLDLVIEDDEDGFEVFIMDEDKKIGEISFVKESKPNEYTIVDATIDDEYKGQRIYPKTIINIFKHKPNIIINSVFRSPEAQKAWIYLLSNLPSNIGKSVKHYKEEDTTLFQLKSRNLQESIKRILREEIKIPLSIRRRVDFDVIDKEFNRVLDMVSETLVQKKSKLISMTAEKFGILVTGRVMGEICYLYPVLCEDNTGLYDTIWEFIKEYYAKQTTERYYDIMFGDINESILKEETEKDFISLEDLNTVIKDYEGGFDVFIMNGDKKIGEISFTKEDQPNHYTITDAKIDDEYKGNRIYPKTIINIFKHKPNIIINSVFRSDEAEKAWKYLLSDLPPNIEQYIERYDEEETTLYQLRLKEGVGTVR